MAPVLPSASSRTVETHKSWKKINEERKVLNKKRKQEKLLENIEKTSKRDELNKSDNAAGATKIHAINPSTMSIAVPGSILENAQSMELRSYVAGQIARAACIFRVNEVIVFDDVGVATARETKSSYETADDGTTNDGSTRTVRSSSLQLARILQYLECPQYLRKFFFPLHKDLKYSGLLNPLDAPHHLRQQNEFRYREGIICEKRAKEGHSYVNVGLMQDVLIDKAIAEGVRVTVKLENPSVGSKKLRGTVVSPEEPRRETGVYWGYSVRIAHSLSEIFTKSPYEGGYDLTMGTSDRATSVHDIPQKSLAFKHLLIVFGGLKGLEEALANDDILNVDEPSLLFDHYVNVLPRQGSRTIRTEEALLIALASLQEKFEPQVPDIEEDLTAYLPRSEDTGITRKHETFGSTMTKTFENIKRKKRQFTPVAIVEKNEEQETVQIKNSNGKYATSGVHTKIIKPKKQNPFTETDTMDDFEVVPAHENKTATAIAAAQHEDLSRFD